MCISVGRREAEQLLQMAHGRPPILTKITFLKKKKKAPAGDVGGRSAEDAASVVTNLENSAVKLTSPNPSRLEHGS